MKKLPLAAVFLLLYSALPGFPATVVSTTPVTNTPLNNVTEPTIVAHTNASGVEVVTSAYMFWTNASTPVVRTVAKTPTAQIDGAPMPLYDAIGDPVLAVNPFGECCIPGPLRTYLAAVEWNQAAASNGLLTVWYSYDGGQSSWIRTIVDLDSRYKYFDKPTIAVSANSSSGTRGWVYVAAMTYTDIKVYRSTNGGVFYQQIAAIPKVGVVHSPSLSVDANTGYVYLAWIDWGLNKIRVARMPPSGGAFTEMTALNTGPLLTVYNNNSLCDGGTCVQAVSMLATRFNPVSNTVGAVWHEREPNDNARTDVKYAYFNPNNGPNGTWLQWHAGVPVTVHSSTAGDQWNPALHMDNQGNYLITWYGRDISPTGYKMYATVMGAWGFKIGVDTTITGDLSNIPSLRSLGAGTYSMGEYHDVYFLNGHWTVAYIFAPPAPPGSPNDNVHFGVLNQ